MAMGFLLRDRLYLLTLTGERDPLGSELARFTRGTAVACFFGRMADTTEGTDIGAQARGRALAITPALSAEPGFVEHDGKVFSVDEVRRYCGFSTDHWELVLSEYVGEVEVS